MKVLFQNRQNALTQRGGDTVLMERLRDGLKPLGVEVIFDLEGRQDPAGFDLVHLFNFALPDMLRHYAERAHRAGTPYVVSTLCEDVPSFHNQSRAVAATLIEYQQRGQDAQWYGKSKVDLRTIIPSPRFQNDWTAEHAAMLFTNGAGESTVLRRDYPRCAAVTEVPLGCEVSAAGSREAFIRDFGLSDFVLCVGRLESRKNQLMLLKALEHSELAVVFAGSGFSYQPDYEAAVRNFRRKGKTVVLPRLTDAQLASAYCAARVHALPSWYELPGLASLEAAHYGCSVVVSDAGTAPDYFGDTALYCDPGDEHSIYNAVLAAFYSPRQSGLQERVGQFTWERTARETYAAYQRVARKTTVQGAGIADRGAAGVPAHYDLSPDVGHAQELIERGEAAARRNEPEAALEFLKQSLAINGDSVRAVRALGAIYLSQSRISEAVEHFRRGLRLAPEDARCLSGLGMCEVMLKEHGRAHDLFVKALAIEPHNLVALMQLIECSYVLNRFEELEEVLRRYNQERPGDTNMQFCLAGCLYRLGKMSAAQEWCDRVLSTDPRHAGGMELQSLLHEAAMKQAAADKPVAIETSPKAERNTVIATPFDGNQLDQRLSELDDAKRARDFAAVKRGVAELMQRADLGSAQREHCDLLTAEVAVLEGEIIKANAIFDVIIGSNADCARAMCGKGAIAAHTGDWAGASAWFEKALTKRPEYDVALAGLGLCNAQAGDADEAWNYYRRAVGSNSENVRALLGMIEVGYALGREGEIESALENYLELHPADLEFLYALAGCYFRRGKYRETTAAVDKILLFRPDHKNALELREHVQRKMSQYRFDPAPTMQAGK